MKRKKIILENITVSAYAAEGKALGDMTTLAERLRQALGLAADATDDAIVTAATTSVSLARDARDPAKLVPASDLTAALARASTAEAALKTIKDEADDKASIISTIISLAHQLKLKVIAEGVETAAQRDMLAALRCDVIQGYLISRPVPAADILAFLPPGRAPVLH